MRVASFFRRLFVVGFLCLFASPPSISSAATSGQIIGTVVDSASHRPVSGATVTVTSPSERYVATSNARGEFAVAGVTLDTYEVSITATGYDGFVLEGATVTGDEALRLNVSLVPHDLRTLGTARSTARSVGSAYQPGQTSDTITVTATQIDQILSKPFNTDQRTLLERLPSVTVDKNNVPLIRGGQSFQTAYQFEGIDYTQPSRGLSNRFSNVANNNVLIGAESLQIVPGGGDATRGNTGTGNIALTAKRGTYPARATFDYEIGLLGGGHQFAGEFGASTKDNGFSNYAAFVASDQIFQYGPYGIPANGIIADPTSIDPSLQSLYTAPSRRFYQTAVFNIANQATRSFLDNAVVRFGHQKNQSLQFFEQDQIVHQDLDYGGFGLFSAIPQTIFYDNNPVVNPETNFGQSFSPLSLNYLTSDRGAAFESRFAPVPFGAIPGQPLLSPEYISNSFNAYKVEYQNNFDGNRSAALRFYRAFTDQQENLPSQGLYVPANGGARSAVALDFTDIVSGIDTVQIGGKYEFATPFGTHINSIDYTGAYAGAYTQIGNGYINLGPRTHDILADFVTPSPVGMFADGTIFGTPGCLGVTLVNGNPYRPVGGAAIPQEHCGYLNRFFKGSPPPLPPEVEIPTARQQSFGYYLQNTFVPQPRLRLSAGIRLDGYNFLIPDDPLNPPAVDGVRHQRLFEPKFGTSFELTKRDYVRANFGRTLEIPLPTFIGTNIDRSAFSAFANIPSYDSVTGKAATYCGVGKPYSFAFVTYYLGTQTCTSYADQLYWLVRNARYQYQNQITSPLKGAAFTNYDFSYGHQFENGIGLRVTPFYRVGYDVVETTQTLLSVDPVSGTQLLSPPLQSNVGSQRATGAELSVTTRPVSTGFSAQLSATYINQIGNTPSTEYLPTASLQLGELYRSPDLSPLQSTLALTYRTKNRLRINPVFTYKKGYPYGTGVLNALTIDGRPYYIPYSDALYIGQYASLLSTCAVNPQYPGTVTNPNCAFTKGLDAPGSGPGTLISKSTLNTDLTIELSALPGSNQFTIGLSIRNLFDDTAGIPAPNYAQNCQLIVTGLCAQTGPAVLDATHGPIAAHGATTGPYLVYPNAEPITIKLYATKAI